MLNGDVPRVLCTAQVSKFLQLLVLSPLLRGLGFGLAENGLGYVTEYRVLVAVARRLRHHHDQYRHRRLQFHMVSIPAGHDNRRAHTGV